MIEDEISTDPFIQNTLQNYPNEEWNRVLKALTVLGIQTLNNSSPQDKVYTVDELEQLINAQPSSSQEQMKESQQIEIQQEEEINSNSEPGIVNKDIEQHIIHHVQESNDIEQSQPTKLEELHEKIEVNHIFSISEVYKHTSYDGNIKNIFEAQKNKFFDKHYKELSYSGGLFAEEYPIKKYVKESGDSNEIFMQKFFEKGGSWNCGFFKVCCKLFCQKAYISDSLKKRKENALKH